MCGKQVVRTFDNTDRHGRLGGTLSGQTAGDIVTRSGERARIGKAIAPITGHVPNSAALGRYLRTVDRWSDEDNALVGIGQWAPSEGVCA
jgi:hypothetical protein